MPAQSMIAFPAGLQPVRLESRATVAAERSLAMRTSAGQGALSAVLDNWPRFARVFGVLSRAARLRKPSLVLAEWNPLIRSRRDASANAKSG